MDYRTLNNLFCYSKQYAHKIICAKGLSDTECMICSYLNSHDLCSQDDVASALNGDKSTIGKALMSLEKKGCIVRTTNPADRRFNQLHLTDLGKEKVSEFLNLHDNWLDEILSCLNAKERAQFEKYCLRVLSEAEKIKKSNK